MNNSDYPQLTQEQTLQILSDKLFVAMGLVEEDKLKKLLYEDQNIISQSIQLIQEAERVRRRGNIPKHGRESVLKSLARTYGFVEIKGCNLYLHASLVDPLIEKINAK